MPKYDAKIEFGPFTGGLYDAGEKEDTPKDSLRVMLGFQYKDGPTPQSENGRLQLTGPQIVADNTVDNGVRWVDAGGNKKLITACDGALWINDELDGSTGQTINTLINTIFVGGTAGTMDGSDTVTVNVGTPHVAKTIKTGTDYFFYDADGRGSGATIETLIGETGFVVPGYSGADDGAFTIERRLGDTVDFALFDGRVAVSDGVLRWHWYGGTKQGETNYIFREQGVGVPDAPDIALAGTLGSLSAGTYQYRMSLEDPRGVKSNPVRIQDVVATANDTATFSNIPSAPEWVTKVQIYRSTVNGTGGFSIATDINKLRLTAATSDGTTSQLTIAAAAADLKASAHKFRTLTYQASTNTFTILDNGTADITVAGDVSAESTTDDVSITGGFILTYAQTGNIADVTGDTALDFDHPYPSDNDQAGTACSQITSFRDDGRLAWIQDTTQIHFSGRSFTANRRLGVNNSGEGRQHPPEFEYSHVNHDVNGDDKKEIVRMWSMEGELFAGREDGIWGLKMPSAEVSGWSWEQRVNLYGIVSKYAVATHAGLTYCLASRAGEYDILAFNGFETLSVGRKRLKATLDEIVRPDRATGVVFRGVYYLSYANTGTNNNRLLGYYLDRRIFDKQGWGCGVFIPPYRSGNSFILLAYAPSNALSHVYQVFGSAQDLGDVIVRQLRSGKRSLDEIAAPDAEYHVVHIRSKGP